MKDTAQRVFEAEIEIKGIAAGHEFDESKDELQVSFRRVLLLRLRSRSAVLMPPSLNFLSVLSRRRYQQTRLQLDPRRPQRQDRREGGERDREASRCQWFVFLSFPSPSFTLQLTIDGLESHRSYLLPPRQS